MDYENKKILNCLFDFINFENLSDKTNVFRFLEDNLKDIFSINEEKIKTINFIKKYKL